MISVGVDDVGELVDQVVVVAVRGELHALLVVGHRLSETADIVLHARLKWFDVSGKCPP